MVWFIIFVLWYRPSPEDLKGKLSFLYQDRFPNKTLELNLLSLLLSSIFQRFSYVNRRIETLVGRPLPNFKQQQQQQQLFVDHHLGDGSAPRLGHQCRPFIGVRDAAPAYAGRLCRQPIGSADALEISGPSPRL